MVSVKVNLIRNICFLFHTDKTQGLGILKVFKKHFLIMGIEIAKKYWLYSVLLEDKEEKNVSMRKLYYCRFQLNPPQTTHLDKKNKTINDYYRSISKASKAAKIGIDKVISIRNSIFHHYCLGNVFQVEKKNGYYPLLTREKIPINVWIQVIQKYIENRKQRHKLEYLCIVQNAMNGFNSVRRRRRGKTVKNAKVNVDVLPFGPYPSKINEEEKQGEKKGSICMKVF
jgi:hypothetical protein